MRCREIFADLSEEKKEFIRENDRERYRERPYMKEANRLKMQKYRAKKKDENRDKDKKN